MSKERIKYLKELLTWLLSAPASEVEPYLRDNGIDMKLFDYVIMITQQLRRLEDDQPRIIT